MSTHPELEAEQNYLDEAYARVDELRDAARSAMEEVIDIGKGGTFQARTERDVVVRNSLARLEQLEIGNQPLCFGRIDEVEGDRYYIGRMGVSGRDQEPLVVDWRAPIAEPFYRATGRFPMGLARRRHFALQGRRLSGIEDEPLVLEREGEELTVSGQGALLAALERSRSGRMQDIVATIQGEQDEVIRSELQGVLVVQGGPGTGKTAVALHRAAYLLYTHRFPLERQGVLVVGPNPIFLRYIGHVLPSLGETGVTLSTISGLVHEASVRATESRDKSALKGDIRMSEFIYNAVRSRQRGLRDDLLVGYGPYQLRVSKEDSASIVSSVKKRGGAHNVRRRRVERLLIEHLFREYNRGVERLRSMDPGAREQGNEEFAQAMREHPAVVDALSRMWPKLHAFELVHDLFGAKPLIKLAARDLLSAEEQALLYRPRSESADDIPWTDADMALIDEARLLLGPIKPLADDEQLIPAFGHVVADEAQDLSPMQLRMLGRRSISGSMTLVGDIAQATGPWAPASWRDVLHYLPEHWPDRLVELTIGYRTPSEAMSLAAGVLAETKLGLQAPNPVRSSGNEPLLQIVPDLELVSAVSELVRNELHQVSGGTIAVVAPNALLKELAQAFTEADVDFDEASGRLEAPVALLPAEMAKGLEFDSVIVVEPNSIVTETPHGLRALYVSLTRTTNRLAVVASQPFPPYLVPATLSS
jgi:DNA helicase IV